MSIFNAYTNEVKKPAFENVNFSDLFTNWDVADTTVTKNGIKHRWDEIVRKTTYGKEGFNHSNNFSNRSYIQGWLCFSDHRGYSLDVLPSVELAEWIDENMLKIEGDRIYFQIQVREDGYFLSAYYNKIIGSRLLAIFPLTENFEKEGE